MDAVLVLILCSMKRVEAFSSELKRRRVVLKQTCFQQDSATPHTANSVIQCFKTNIW